MDAPDTIRAALIGVLKRRDHSEGIVGQSNPPAYGVAVKVVTQLVDVRSATIFMHSFTLSGCSLHPGERLDRALNTPFGAIFLPLRLAISFPDLT
jgi:hypothetical protein